MGNCCSAMMTARAKNGMKVSRAPWRFSNADLFLLRRLNDAGKVHLEHAVHVSAGAARLDHALGDDLAHLAHGHEIAGDGCRALELETQPASRRERMRRGAEAAARAGLTLLEKCGDVLLGYAATQIRCRKLARG